MKIHRLRDWASLPNDEISHQQHNIDIEHRFVSADKNEKFVSLPTSDSYMLRNHEAGLSYIKNPQKTYELA